MNKWQSTGLYEHPAKHRAGEYGKIELLDSEVYVLRVGATINCPQDWAAAIHRQEIERKTISDYLLRNIPDELWRRAKHQAVDEKISLRDLILRAIRDYLDPKKEAHTP